MGLNELKLNHDRTDVMLIHSKYRPSPSFQSLCVGDDSVAACQSAKSLGLIFDKHMSFHAHVSSICRSSFYHLRNLSRIRKYFTKESAEVAVHAFVTSKLDYCNALLYGLPKYQLQRLQYVQNKTRRLELCCKWVRFSISHLFCVSFTGYRFNIVLFSRFCSSCIDHWMGHRLAI